MIAEASAPAKIILCGEHAVVYGQPAIAIPVPSLKATAKAYTSPKPGSGLIIKADDLNQEFVLTDATDFDSSNPLLIATSLFLSRLGITVPDMTIVLHSDIPIASGLGSGAAITTALLRVLSLALEQTIDNGVLNEMVYEVEKVHHGNPSGVDNTVIVYERPVYFVRDQVMEWFSVPQRHIFLIGDTGVGASTHIAVSAVRTLYETQYADVKPIIDSIGQIVIMIRQALETGDTPRLGHLMLENHKLLQRLTVSSEGLDALVEAAGRAGALGAKLSGGGRGGNMIALVDNSDKDTVREALINAGASQVFRVTLG